MEGKLQAPMPAKAAPVSATAEAPHIVTTAQVLPAREGRLEADLSSTSSNRRTQLEAGTSSLLSKLTICRAQRQCSCCATQNQTAEGYPSCPPAAAVCGWRQGREQHHMQLGGPSSAHAPAPSACQNAARW